MRRLAMAGLLGLLVAGLAASSRADLIFFKDGYVLQGKIKREGTTEYDPGSKDFTWMPKGLYFIDDGPRRVYFTATQVAIVERLAAPNEERIIRAGLDELAVVPNKRPPLIEEVNEPGEWDYEK